MSTTAYAEAATKHRIPVIDRMMEVLGQLERRESGSTIRDLVQQLKLPRTTIYRILNTLQLHDMVRRDDAGAYQLGSRLLGLAARVPAGAGEVDLAALGQPVLDRLSDLVGEGCKLSVLDKDDTLVIATSPGRREYALSVTPGQRLATHAGAAGKILLAYMADVARRTFLARPLAAFTSRTMTDPRRLQTELTKIRRLGWAFDKGEGLTSVQAYAAPVFDGHSELLAAISTPFLAGTEPSHMEEIRLATIAAAKELTGTVARG